MVAIKELIFDHFYLGGCGGLESTDLDRSLRKIMVDLKGTDLS